MLHIIYNEFGNSLTLLKVHMITRLQLSSEYQLLHWQSELKILEILQFLGALKILSMHLQWPSGVENPTMIIIYNIYSTPYTKEYKE